MFIIPQKNWGVPPLINYTRILLYFHWARPRELARVQGFEPQHSEPESDVLPLDDTRVLIPLKLDL